MVLQEPQELVVLQVQQELVGQQVRQVLVVSTEVRAHQEQLVQVELQELVG
jgi:hypothetical protein